MTRTLWTLGMIALAGTAAAETFQPLPSIADVTDGDGWAFGLGAGVEYEAEYDGSDDCGVEAEPGLIVQWRRGDQMAFLEGQELGWRTRRFDRWLLQAGLRYEEGREESQADELQGLGDVDDEWVAMVEARRALSGDWRSWGAVRVMAGDSDIGALGVLALGRTFPARAPGMGVDLFAFATVASSAFINRDFGVTPEQSVGSGLPVTHLDGGYRSFGVQAVGRWRLGARDRWQLQAELGFERYNGDIADSPITRDDYEAEAGLSLLYRF